MTKAESQPAQELFAQVMTQPGMLERVAQFCKVTSTTVLTWHNNRWPRGEPQYRLWAFLELNGYSVSELVSLPTPSHRLALLMASDICSYEEVRTELGYESLTSVYRLIRNDGAPSGEKFRLLERLLEAYGPALDEYVERYGTSLPPVTVKPREPDVERVVQDLFQAGGGDEDAVSVELTARLLQQLVRRIDRVDVTALAQRVKQSVAPEQIENLAVLLLELV